MVESPLDFADLMKRVQDRSDGAARLLLESYGEHILRVVRCRLNRKLRPKFDSHDFVQAVWASFFGMAPERIAFDRPEALGAFLAQLANNKVVDVVRQRLQTLKHNAHRECSLEGPEALGATIAARAASPEVIAIAREEWQRLVNRQPGRHREIAQCVGGGMAPRQAAEFLGLSEKTILRVIRKIQSQDHE
jgi:RNA polymerase sigma factor (sigma-70 family)